MKFGEPGLVNEKSRIRPVVPLSDAKEPFAQPTVKEPATPGLRCVPKSMPVAAASVVRAPVKLFTGRNAPPIVNPPVIGIAEAGPAVRPKVRTKAASAFRKLNAVSCFRECGSSTVASEIANSEPTL